MMQSQITAEPKLFIGMDIHKKSWSVHMRTDLCDHKGFSMPADAGKLVDYVNNHFSTHQVSLTYEAGCCGFSAARYFLNLGWQVKVVNASDVPRSDKQNYQKTDKLDSRNLCKQLQQDQLTGIFIPTEHQEQLRSLLRQRNQVVKQLRVVKSQIKGLLLFHGIKVPDEFDNPNWSKYFLQWLADIQWSYITGAACLKSKMRILDVLNAEYLQTSNELRAYCRKHHNKDYYLLKSIPGIGGLLASAIIAELGDIRRFNKESEFANYIGLVPAIHQSSETDNKRGLTPRCKALLRSYLIEAAWVAIRMDPEVQAYYRKHVIRDTKSAIVKVAHKMCRRILSVIKTETPYQISYSLNKK
ncbi:IS110 family transposase [Pollutibacter soli]|uniref:IS110 family transposase n=1 Tax=Pollutibacter soli TaxID=3034157 RepID=UPI003013F954